MSDRPLYDILGVRSWATPEEIRAGYYKMAMIHHPIIGSRFSSEHGKGGSAPHEGDVSTITAELFGCCRSGESNEKKGGATTADARGGRGKSSPSQAVATSNNKTNTGSLPQSSGPVNELASGMLSADGKALEEVDFDQIQSAFDVLSDETRRGIYDRYGELGLLQLGSAPSGVSDTLQCVGTQFIMLVIMILVCIAISAMIVFLVLLCRKVEGDIDWKWYYVFTPLYFVILELCVIAFAGAFGLLSSFVERKNNDEADDHLQDLPSPPLDFPKLFGDMAGTIFTLGWVAFCVTCSVALQKIENERVYNGNVDFQLNWWLYFIPCIISEGSLLVSTLTGFPRLYVTLIKRGIAKDSRVGINVLVLIDVVVKCCRVVGIFLIAARVNANPGDRLYASWWVIFIPYYLTIAFMIGDAVFLAQLRKHSSTTVTGQMNLNVVDVKVPHIFSRSDRRKMRRHGGGGGGHRSSVSVGRRVGAGDASNTGNDDAVVVRGGEEEVFDDTFNRRTASAVSFESSDSDSDAEEEYEVADGDEEAVRKALEQIAVKRAKKIAERRARAETQHDSAHHPSIITACYTSTIFAGLPLAMLLMLASKLEGNDGLPLQYCFIPIFIMLAASICAALCVGLFLIASSHSMEDDIRSMESHAAAEDRRLKALLVKGHSTKNRNAKGRGGKANDGGTGAASSKRSRDGSGGGGDAIVVVSENEMKPMQRKKD